jgi:prepilin-type N-terminal cleavage/methylation domain-containing protein
MMRSTRRHGFTLVEMVVVLTVLALLLMVGTGMVATVWKAARMGEAAETRSSQRFALAKQFRSDVARAEKAEADAGILRLRLADGATIRHAWADGTLTRTERKGNGEQVRPFPLAGSNVAMAFQSDTRLCILRITETPKNGLPKVAEYAAALGGDTR